LQRSMSCFAASSVGCGVRVHLLTSGVNHDETVASRFYAAFVAHEFYHNGTISQVGATYRI